MKNWDYKSISAANLYALRDALRNSRHESQMGFVSGLQIIENIADIDTYSPDPQSWTVTSRNSRQQAGPRDFQTSLKIHQSEN